MPVRAVTDGRFKYIRSYIPYRQFALRNYYQWGMPSNKAWDKLVLGGHNTNPDWKQTFEPHPAEMLFDLEKDPDELHDLSAIPEYAETLYKMRQALSDHIRTIHDLGFSSQIHVPDIYFMRKYAKRNIPWMSFMSLSKLRERQL